MKKLHIKYISDNEIRENKFINKQKLIKIRKYERGVYNFDYVNAIVDELNNKQNEIQNLINIYQLLFYNEVVSNTDVLTELLESLKTVECFEYCILSVFPNKFKIDLLNIQNQIFLSDYRSLRVPYYRDNNLLIYKLEFDRKDINDIITVINTYTEK